MIVLACKSAPSAIPSDNVVDPNVTNQISNPFNAGLVELTGGLEDRQRKMRNAFKWVVRSVAEVKGEKSGARAFSFADGAQANSRKAASRPLAVSVASPASRDQPPPCRTPPTKPPRRPAPSHPSTRHAAQRSVCRPFTHRQYATSRPRHQKVQRMQRTRCCLSALYESRTWTYTTIETT
jgi:hypothetical protein